MSEHTEFKRDISLLDATMIVVGIMIGSGIFIVSADIARQVGSAGWLLVVWGVTGVITLIGALSYGELGGLFPQAGGQYIYLREAYNPLIAFLYGWTCFMVIQTGSIAAVGMAFAKYSAVLIEPLDEKYKVLSIASFTVSRQQVFAIAMIVFLTWVNTRGVRTGKWIQNVFTFAKIGSMIGLVLLAVFVGYNHEVVARNFSDCWHAFSVTVTEGSTVPQVIQLTGFSIVTAIAVSQVGSLFSSDGWNNLTFAAAEVVNPKKNIPLALAFGTIIVTVLYLSVNIAYLITLPVAGNPSGGVMAQGIQFATSDRVGAASAAAMFPEYGAMLMAITIMVSTFGCNNGMILAGARCYYAMAKDALFFTSVGKLNTKAVPATALWLQCLWASCLCLSGKYGDLLDYVIFAVLLFYIATIIGIFVLRRKLPNAERPVKAVGYPFLPILYIVMATFISCVLLIEKPMYTFPGLVIVLLGVPVYFVWRKVQRA